MIKKLKNMSISKRLMTSYIIVLVLLVIGVVVSVSNLISIGSQIEQFYEHPYVVSSAANSLDSNFEKMVGAVYRALANDDMEITNNAIAEAKEASTGIQSQLAIIEELFLGDKAIVESLKEKLETLQPMREYVLELAAENHNVEAAAYMEKNNAVIIAEAQPLLQQIIENANTTGDKLISSLQSTQSVSIIILIALCLASVIISLMFAKVITDSIMEPVRQIELCSESMSEGILDSSMITYNCSDELGALSNNLKETIAGISTVIKDISYLTYEMSRGNFNIDSKNSAAYKGDFAPVLEAINHMTLDLSSVLSQINEASEQVSAGSNQMAESAQTLAEGATEQAGAVQELTATVEDVANAAKGTADSTKKAAIEVNNSVQKAETGRRGMQNLIQAMEEIDVTSKEIAKIIDAIEDIASQTNLLSLNASIEAARAGDAGRGFAVVANQIGKLASDSALSAANTHTLITTILDKIRVGNEITNSTAESFEEIITGIESFAGIAETTSEMADNQYNTMQEVREGIEQIAKVVQDNSSAAEETSATSEELAAQAVNLKSQVGKFKIKNG